MENTASLLPSWPFQPSPASRYFLFFLPSPWHNTRADHCQSHFKVAYSHFFLANIHSISRANMRLISSITWFKAWPLFSSKTKADDCENLLQEDKKDTLPPIERTAPDFQQQCQQSMLLKLSYLAAYLLLNLMMALSNKAVLQKVWCNPRASCQRLVALMDRLAPSTMAPDSGAFDHHVPGLFSNLKTQRHPVRP